MNDNDEQHGTGSFEQDEKLIDANRASLSHPGKSAAGVKTDPNKKFDSAASVTNHAAQINQKETLNAVQKDGKISTIVAGIVAFATLGQWFTAYLNNTSSSHQADKMIAATQRSEEAASRFAASSQLINEGIASAVKKLDAQAKAIETSRKVSQLTSRTALQATVNISRVDQRAWIGFGDPIFTLNLTTPIKADIRITIYGKSPAIRITTRESYNGINKDNKLQLADIFYQPGNQISSSGTAFPTQGFPIRITNASSTPEMDQKIVKSISNGSITFFFFGEVTYQDVFKRDHWTHFCYIVDKDLTNAHPCSIYNDSDNDVEESK